MITPAGRRRLQWLIAVVFAGISIPCVLWLAFSLHWSPSSVQVVLWPAVLACVIPLATLMPKHEVRGVTFDAGTTVIRGFRPVGEEIPGRLHGVVAGAKDSRRLFVRTDILFYDAGIVTVHWRAELRTPHSRVRNEQAASPAELLARDPRNRYIPWEAIREVRIGMSFGNRVILRLRNGEVLRFACGTSLETDFVSAVQDFIPEDEDQASETSSSRSALQ